MQEINAWLISERDFTKGAELYQKHGTNSFFKSLLKAGPTPYNTKKLGEELESLAPGSPASFEVKAESLKVKGEKAESIKLKAESEEAAVSSVLTATEKADNHRKYLKLLNERDDLVLKLDKNMAALDFLPSGPALFETAKQVLRLDARKREVWRLIDYYELHGGFEPVKEVPVKSREEQMQLIYQSNSKARTRLKDPTYQGAARKRTEMLIQQNLKKLDELKGGDV